MRDEKKRDLSDGDDWRSFKGGDKTALARLFKRYYPILNHYGCKAFHDSDVVEDCIQELFIYLWDHKNTLSEVSSVKYYLISCLRRRLLNNKVIRKREQDLFQLLLEEGIFPSIHSEENILLAFERDENLFERIKREIQNLPERQREAFILRFVEQKSYEEITGIMNVSYQSGRTYVYKALLSLKSKFVNLDESLSKEGL